MIEAIIGILTPIFAYLAAKGVDLLVGKWLAYITIAFEQTASQAAKEAFTKSIDEIKKNSPEKAKAWDEWRKRYATPKPDPQNMV